MRPLSAGIVALGALGAALFAGIGLPDEARSVAAPSGRTGITTSGTGTVVSVPDHASFSFGVETQGETAKAALEANAGEMRRVIEALRDAGIDVRDIRTESVQLHSRYANDGQRVVGYSATNAVSAETDDLDKAGEVIDAAVGAGANQVSGPALTREDRDSQEHEALRRAVAEARAKAEVLADAAGVSLGAATTVVETSAGPPPMPYYERSALAADAATPIQAGTAKVEATVSVTFALS
jgi:uncharacterized protein YggE